MLSLGLYSWTVDFPMVFDDHSYLIDNPIFPETASLGYLARFNEFANYPAKIGADPDYAVNFILRPVAYATFHLNHWFDGFNPRWYRAVNIGIHTLNALLLYGLMATLLRPFHDSGKIDRFSRHFIPATTALIFAAHPLAIESVTYIIQRFTSLAALFSLLSLWLHFLSLFGRSQVGVWLLRAGSVVALLLAMQTKEYSVMIPILAICIDWLVLKTHLRSAMRRSLPLLLCTPLIPTLVLLISTAQNGGNFDLGNAFHIVNSRDAPLNHWHYVVTQITVIVHYLRLMVWPVGLNIDPEWPIYHSLWQKPVLLSLALLSSLIVIVWRIVHRHQEDVRMALAWIGALWFFTTISVSSGLVPLPDMMAEHRTYLPSIGIFILITALFDAWRIRWQTARNTPTVPIALAALALLGLIGTTIVRNQVWRSNESLWQDAVAKSPGKYRTWGNLGTAYSSVGKETAAVDCYRQAVKIEPRFQPALLNLANSCLRLNQPKDALDAINRLIQVNPGATRSPSVAIPLGLGLMGIGRHNEAALTFRELLETVPDCVQAHKALGMIYGQMGIHQRALEHYQIAARLHSEDPFLASLIAETQHALATPPIPAQSGRGPGSLLRFSSD
jgi:Tfp pilus assembly protein PilF